jgi:hypothetical protein
MHDSADQGAAAMKIQPAFSPGGFELGWFCFGLGRIFIRLKQKSVMIHKSS